MAVSLIGGRLAEAFKSRNYNIFWMGQFNLGLGVWVYRLAVAWLTWEMTHSTAWLGTVAAGHMLPVLLLCPIAGVTADRIGHLRQLLIMITLTGVTALALAVLAETGHLGIEVMLALVLANGVARAFSIPPRQAIMPQLVAPRLLPSAIGFNSATYWAANFAGPALGGALIAWSGVGIALGYFVAGAVIAVASLAFLKLAPRERKTRRSSLMADLVEGVRYAARHPGVRMMIVMELLLALFVQPYIEMLASFADQVFGMGRGGLALLASASGAGAMCGGLWIAWRGRTEGLARILLAFAVSALVALAAFAASPVLWLSLPALFVTGFSVVVGSTCCSSLIQGTIDPAFRARVMAFDSMMSIGGPAVGALLIGWLGTYFGVQAPLVTAAVLGLAVWLVVAPKVRAEIPSLEGVPAE